jgi:hypothetical protein
LEQELESIYDMDRRGSTFRQASNAHMGGPELERIEKYMHAKCDKMDKVVEDATAVTLKSKSRMDKFKRILEMSYPK